MLPPRPAPVTPVSTPTASRRVILLVLAGVLLLGGIGGGIFLYQQHQQDLRTGHFVRLPSVAPGQPTPTAPPGTFIFKDVTGASVLYQPPQVPPSLSWQTYRNSQDGYSIRYPAGWINAQPVSDGHTQLAIYPPGTDVNSRQPGEPQGITIGWTSAYQAPSGDDSTVANLQSISAGGVAGQFYTQSALGSTMTAAFPYRGGTVVLQGTADSDLVIYVFRQMLTSLQFG